MKIYTNRIYFICEDNKIKKFIVKAVHEYKGLVTGYIEGEGSVHIRDISWLQEHPNKLKRKYRGAIKYFKKYGNKNIGILKDDFSSVVNKEIKKEVIVLRKYLYLAEKNNLGEKEVLKLVSFIDSNGIIKSANRAWFTNLK